MDTISGSVERITYYNPENGYSVVRLRPENNKVPGKNREGLVTVTGNLPELSPGEHLRLNGRWTTHARHGLQFQAEFCEQALPASIAGMRRYLGSGLIKGIGPGLAERIVRHFGLDTLEVIESRPERLLQVPDIGPVRARKIAQAWEEQKQVKEIMLFLHTYGVSTNLAIKIYKQYSSQAVQVIKANPYQLAGDISGVGFKTADRIARALGLPVEHPSRIESGLVYALNEMVDDGHVYAPYQLLIQESAKLLEVIPKLIPPAIDRLVQEGRLRKEVIPFEGHGEASGFSPAGTEGVSEQTMDYGHPALYLPPLYYSETGLAERLKKLAYFIPSRLSDLPPAFLSLDPTLSPEQQLAIRTAISHPVSVLTGGPGTGKTTAIRALIHILEANHKTYALASPTGRAAKRLSEASGRPASTIHRLLGFSPGTGFKHNAENTLKVDLVVVDEASMLDLLLANNLIKAVQPGTHLLLVGDVDQLPSVGAGDVLRDVIASEMAAVTRLGVIFRQAAGSHIITNAHRINQGQVPLFTKESGDFFLFPAERAEEAARWVEEVVCKRIPQKFGLDAYRQVQVMAPLYRGPAGVTALNDRLQAALNPGSGKKPEARLFGVNFRSGDKVMQIQNNYEKDVYNGDIGQLITLDAEERSLEVDFEGRRVRYDWNEADQLVLAYAVSVHKAQGSEYPAVVVPLVPAHYMMLQRNLLYTAVTRARRLCVLVGSQRAIGMAVRNDKVAHRYTALDWRLRKP